MLCQVHSLCAMKEVQQSL